MSLEAFPSILGGALLPHAPQFFTRPETEDADNIARVEKVAARIGEQLAALKPDVWITISNDHAQQFFLDCAPPFALHVGGEARGSFAVKLLDTKITSEPFRQEIEGKVNDGVWEEQWVARACAKDFTANFCLTPQATGGTSWTLGKCRR